MRVLARDGQLAASVDGADLETGRGDHEVVHVDVHDRAAVLGLDVLTLRAEVGERPGNRHSVDGARRRRMQVEGAGMSARHRDGQLVLSELRHSVSVVVGADHERAAAGERHRKRGVAPVGAPGEPELPARHLGARIACHGRRIPVDVAVRPEERIAHVHRVSVQIVGAAGAVDRSGVHHAVAVDRRGAADQRERRAGGHVERRLDVRRVVVVADLRARAVHVDAARVPGRVGVVELHDAGEVDAVRDVDLQRGALELQPAILRDDDLPDGDCGVDAKTVAVVHLHGERDVGRPRDGVAPDLKPTLSADRRVARQLDAAAQGVVPSRGGGGRDERALTVGAVAFDDELLFVGDQGARTVRAARRVVVVDVELPAGLHGDRAAVRARRAHDGVVADFHRAALDVDVGRRGEHARLECERARSPLHEPLGRDRARAAERVVLGRVDHHLLRHDALRHLHGRDLRRFLSVEERRPRGIERDGRARAVLQPRDRRPDVARRLRTPHALAVVERIAHAARRAHVLAVHAREAEVPRLAGREARRRGRHRAGLRDDAQVRGARHRGERGIGGPFERDGRRIRALAEAHHLALHRRLAAAFRRDAVDAHERRVRRHVSRRPDFDPRHLVGEARHPLARVRVAHPRPVDGFALMREVADADLVAPRRGPAVEREHDHRGIRRAGREAVHLHGAIAAHVVRALVVPVAPERLGWRVGKSAWIGAVRTRPELDPAAHVVRVGGSRLDAGHVRLHAQAVHDALVDGRERDAHVVERAAAERVHRHPDPPRQPVVGVERGVPALQLDVVADAGDVRRGRRVVHEGVRHVAERRKAGAAVRRDVEHAGARHAREVLGGDVVLAAACRLGDGLLRAELESGIVRDRAEDGGAVDVRHLVLARPVGMEVRLGEEAADDVVAARVVAVARRVEVREVRALRGERRARDGVADRRVERNHLRVLRLAVRDVHHRARDELHVRLLVQRLPHEVRPHGEQLLGGRAVGVDVVRADLGEDEIDVARAVEHGLDRVDRAAAVLRDEALPADAGVPHPLVGHHRAADVGAVDVPVALRDGRVPGGGELLHEARAPVAVGRVAALRDGVARAEDVDALLRRGVVEVEPEASAARLEVLGPHLHVRTLRARRVEDRVERGGVHVERAVVPRHQQEAPLRVRRVLGRERDLRARGERGRRDEPEGELRGIVDELAGGAHVKRGEVEAAHLRERGRAVHHERRGSEAHGVVADVREGRTGVLRKDERRVCERRRRRVALGPVPGRREARVRRARPCVIGEVGAGGGIVVVLHPEVDAHEGVGVGGDVARVPVVHARPVEIPVRGVAVVAVVGEGSHADRAVVGGRGTPAVVGEEDLARGEGVRIRELAHQLEAAVSACP